MDQQNPFWWIQRLGLGTKITWINKIEIDEFWKKKKRKKKKYICSANGTWFGFQAIMSCDSSYLFLENGIHMKQTIETNISN